MGLQTAAPAGRILSAFASASPRRLTSAGAVLALLMFVLGAVVLVDARNDAWRMAERASANLATALADDVSRNLAVYDLSLQGAVDAMRLPGIADASPAIRHSAMFDRAAGAEFLGVVVVLDPSGTVTASSASPFPPRTDLGDREYFRVHRDRADAGLFVSRPYGSRLGTREESIAISRRISGPSGEFLGVVAGGIRLAYFNALFGRMDLGNKGVVALLRTVGRLLARSPPLEGALDRDLSSSDLARHFRQERSGQFVGLGAIDGVRRLYNFRHVEKLELVLAVAVSVDDIYAAWWGKALVIGPILAFLCAAAVGMSLLFGREVGVRLAAEGRLRSTAANLTVMADTDGLTGLSNRRAFDAALAREWARAAGSGAWVGVVMVDADHFKSYNDLRGHQEGDEVLRRIAGAVRGAVRRPGDAAARYGGEEFAAVLAGADAAGTAAVGEALRAAVSVLAMEHPGQPGGRVTVSVGAAAAFPASGGDAASLVGAADAALYEAKRSGRDRVASAPPA